MSQKIVAMLPDGNYYRYGGESLCGSVYHGTSSLFHADNIGDNRLEKFGNGNEWFATGLDHKAATFWHVWIRGTSIERRRCEIGANGYLQLMPGETPIPEGCGHKIQMHGKYYSHCGTGSSGLKPNSDFGPHAGTLCTECGGTYKRKYDD